MISQAITPLLRLKPIVKAVEKRLHSNFQPKRTQTDPKNIFLVTSKIVIREQEILCLPGTETLCCICIKINTTTTTTTRGKPLVLPRAARQFDRGAPRNARRAAGFSRWFLRHNYSCQHFWIIFCDIFVVFFVNFFCHFLSMFFHHRYQYLCQYFCEYFVNVFVNIFVINCSIVLSLLTHTVEKPYSVEQPHTVE